MQVWLKKKGLASANKKANRIAAEGVIETYIHAGANLGVLIEVNCETDFVAKGDTFKELAANLAMQVSLSTTHNSAPVCVFPTTLAGEAHSLAHPANGVTGVVGCRVSPSPLWISKLP